MNVMSEAAERAQALYEKGDRLHDEGDYAGAVACLNDALATDHSHWLARYTLAVVFQDLGRHDQARDLYETLLADGKSHPKRAKAWLNLGVARHHLGLLEPAEAAYREALTLDATLALAAKNLADLLVDHGDESGARAVLTPFLNRRQPSAIDLCEAMLLPAIPESDQAIEAAHAHAIESLHRLREMPPQIVDPLREVGRLPYFQIGHGLDNLPLLTALRDVFRAACPRLAFVAPHVLGYRGPQLKVKVGFVSAYLGEHSVGRAMRGLIEGLPRSRFEVVVGFLGGRGSDAIATAIAASADQVIDVPYDVFAAQEILSGLELDALVFPDIGMEMLSYCLALGRLAPYQVTTWGQPDSSGIDTVDHYVSVASWEGRDGPELRYTEQLIYFKDVATPSWLKRPEFPSDRPGLPGDSLRLYCPHGAQKLHPDFDELLPEILTAAPGARLFLHEPAIAGWASRLKARIDRAFEGKPGGAKARERLVWLPPVDRAGYLANLRSADLLLDTPYFGGGPVMVDAVAAGVPFVTFGAPAQRARVGAGLLEFMGIPGFIAHSSRDFVAMVAQLARDSGSRLSYRSAIVERAPVVFEDDRVIERWASLLEAGVVEKARTPGRMP